MLSVAVGRVLRRRLGGLWLAVALPIVFLVPLLGCREEEVGGGSSGAIRFEFSVRRGDRVEYYNWRLDQYGYRISASQFRDTWTVIDTGAQYRGRSSVSVIIDSVFATGTGGGETLSRVDTLYFHITPGGDIYKYGFLSAIVRRRENAWVDSEWDRIAAFPLGSSTGWIVGYADSLKRRPVYGQIVPEREYIAVDVNGVQTVLSTYRVDMFASGLDLRLWLTDSPPAILGIRDESEVGVTGLEKEILAIRRAGN